MKRVALTVALLLAASPAVAQDFTPGQGTTHGQASGASSLAPATGTICDEENGGTFCNFIGSPSNGGYGASNGSGGTAGSSSVPTPTPPCGDFPPANELCN
jgi:hypothetical protein